ncbi:MAG: phosphoglycolate phosphatase [Pseudomonadota bacterium]
MPENTQCVLFDLDGTLLDTAPDLAGALNAVLIDEGRLPSEIDVWRPYVSQGAMALVCAGFGITPESSDAKRLWRKLLDHYAQHLCEQTRFFDGIEELLDLLSARNTPWGIVTNKPEFLTTPLLHQLGLHRRSAVTVCGDTLEFKKPHPAPLLFAAEKVGILPASTVFVGDDRRDIEAGRAAEMKTIAAGYGYIGPDESAADWGADVVVDRACEIKLHLPKF